MKTVKDQDIPAVKDKEFKESEEKPGQPSSQNEIPNPKPVTGIKTPAFRDPRKRKNKNLL